MNPEIDIERILDADVKDVWLAITDRDLMAQWYFNLKEFKAQVGFTFEFLGGPEAVSYTHLDVYKRQLKSGEFTATKKMIIIE